MPIPYIHFTQQVTARLKFRIKFLNTSSNDVNWRGEGNLLRQLPKWPDRQKTITRAVNFYLLIYYFASGNG